MRLTRILGAVGFAAALFFAARGHADAQSYPILTSPSLTLNSSTTTVTMPYATDGYGTCMFTIPSIGTGNVVTAYYAQDNTNYQPVGANTSQGGSIQTISSVGIYSSPCGHSFQLHLTTVGTGNVTVSAIQALPIPFVWSGGSGSGGVVTQGAAGSNAWLFIAQPWTYVICSGTVGSSISCVNGLGSTICSSGSVSYCTIVSSITVTTSYHGLVSLSGTASQAVGIEVFDSSSGVSGQCCLDYINASPGLGIAQRLTDNTQPKNGITVDLVGTGTTTGSGYRVNYVP